MTWRLTCDARAVALGVLLASGPAVAADSPDAAWAMLATVDIDALDADIAALHPAMRDPRTPDFAAQVERAHVAARADAARARSYLDWRAATTAFMLSFRDGHTIFRPTLAPARACWPGFLIDGRGGGYVVRDVGRVPLDAGLAEGTVITACDGVALGDLLAARLDAREADWSKPPERIRQAWRLFVDYRSAGPPPIKACTVATASGPRTIALNWRTIAWTDLAGSLGALQREPAERRPIALDWQRDGSAWIGIGSFGDEARLGALQTALTAAQVRLGAAPYVVFDLRGNRGGNSTWGEVFGGILWGETAVAGVEAAASGKFWRASPTAARRVAEIADEFDAMGAAMAGPAAYFRQIAGLIAKHPGGDATLMPDPSFEAAPPPRAAPATKLFGGKAYVLTDAGCFSSCVVAMGTFKRLGAVQVGEVSGQNDEYGEVVGPLTTPSGLARYSLPVTIIRQRRSDLGGLPVDVPWSGAMDDDAGLRAWIAGMAQGNAKKQRTPE